MLAGMGGRQLFVTDSNRTTYSEVFGGQVELDVPRPFGTEILESIRSLLSAVLPAISLGAECTSNHQSIASSCAVGCGGGGCARGGMQPGRSCRSGVKIEDFQGVGRRM